MFCLSFLLTINESIQDFHFFPSQEIFYKNDNCSKLQRNFSWFIWKFFFYFNIWKLLRLQIALWENYSFRLGHKHVSTIQQINSQWKLSVIKNVWNYADWEIQMKAVIVGKYVWNIVWDVFNREISSFNRDFGSKLE